MRALGNDFGECCDCRQFKEFRVASRRIIASVFDEGNQIMAPTPERIASLETHRTWHWTVLVAVATIGCTWLSWTSITLFSIKADLQAIKQKMKDGGLGEIVAELKSPSSSEQLKANLLTVTAQMQMARVNGEKPDKKKVQALSNAISGVVQKEPQVAEAWRAAAELITFRSSQEQRSDLKICGDPGTGSAFMEAKEAWLAEPDPKPPVFVGMEFHDCRIDLDNPVRTDGRNIFADITHFNHVDSRVLFRNAVITYRGGVIPIRYLAFKNCVYDFYLNAPPPSPGAAMTRTLLAAADASTLDIDLPA